jgi:hypothetical protein
MTKKKRTGSGFISILLSCFDEGFGFFEEGEVFFDVGGFGGFDDDPFLHGSFAHCEEGDVVAFEQSSDSFFGKLEDDAVAGAAGEDEDVFSGEEAGVVWELLFFDAGQRGEKRGEGGDQLCICYKCDLLRGAAGCEVR